MPNLQPNIVLVCADQWRADCLGSAGHPVVDTPYLDQLAGAGARFAHAYSSCPTCIAARAALMTGLGQRRHGRTGYQDGVPWRYERTLGSCFTAAGYQTQVVGKMHVYPERWRAGFEHVVLHDGFLHHARKHAADLGRIDDYIPWLRAQPGYAGADYFDHGVNCNSFVARPWDKPEHLHPTNWVTSESIDFLRRRDPTRPFLLYVSYHRPHPPLDPPAWAYQQYLDQELPPVPLGDWAELFARFRKPGSPEAHVGPQPPERLRRARAGYYGALTHIDHQINRLVEGLTDANLDRPTVFCFTSDHGEMLGDHHLFRKAYAYEGSAGIPLLFHNVPGVKPGTVCDGLAELRDLMPTLLDIAGIPVPEGLDGVSLLPALRGQGAAPRPHLHGEHVVFGQSMQWIRDPRWKYVWLSGDGHEQLFDLMSDPRELHDCAAAHPAEVQRLRALLIAALEGSPEGYVADGRLVPGRKPSAVQAWAQTGR